MGIMLDDMKRFTEELRSSIKDRKSDLRHIENMPLRNALRRSRAGGARLARRIARWPSSRG